MSLALALLSAHLLGDFYFQPSWMAKQKMVNVRIRLVHAYIHGVLAMAFLIFVLSDFRQVALAGLFVLVVHFIIDSRRWVEAPEDFPLYPVCVDQSFHVVSLYVLVVVVL